MLQRVKSALATKARELWATAGTALEVFNVPDGLCMDVHKVIDLASQISAYPCHLLPSPVLSHTIQAVYFALPSQSSEDLEEGSCTCKQPLEFIQANIRQGGITSMIGVSESGKIAQPLNIPEAIQTQRSVLARVESELPLLQEDFDSNGDDSWGWHVDGVATVVLVKYKKRKRVESTKGKNFEGLWCSVDF
jgi:hypothetical protein